MTTKTSRDANRERVRSFRERRKHAGLRLVQLWVPDVRTPAFKAEARRQALRVAQSGMALDDQDFVDAISEFKA
jgi:hypothetical protein